MRAVLCLALCFAFLFAIDDCNAIFEARKGEIFVEIDRLDVKKSEFDALKAATERVMIEKDEALRKKEAEIDEKLKRIEEINEEIKQRQKANETVLDQIRELKDAKLAGLYGGMKPGSAGDIMNSLDPYLAAEILSQLDGKIAAGIIARMEPSSAAAITGILHKGPPYMRDKNATASGD
ncbi:MAG: PDP protein [Helicobacteraceae bacterium]|jgi:flagellar motility protein MotE (MotC chaperone)|nr:PDP protein [Helicobacteraceae bacterium]